MGTAARRLGITGKVLRRKLWLPVMLDAQHLLDGATAGTIGASPNVNPVALLAAGATQTVLFEVALPDLAPVGDTITVAPWWIAQTTVGGNTSVNWALVPLAVSDAASAVSAGTGTSFTGVSRAQNANQLNIEPEVAFTPAPTSAQLLRLALRRVTGDTYTGTAGLVGMMLTYTAFEGS